MTRYAFPWIRWMTVCILVFALISYDTFVSSRSHCQLSALKESKDWDQAEPWYDLGIGTFNYLQSTRLAYLGIQIRSRGLRVMRECNGLLFDVWINTIQHSEELNFNIFRSAKREELNYYTWLVPGSHACSRTTPIYVWRVHGCDY